MKFVFVFCEIIEAQDTIYYIIYNKVEWSPIQWPNWIDVEREIVRHIIFEPTKLVFAPDSIWRHTY